MTWSLILIGIQHLEVSSDSLPSLQYTRSIRKSLYNQINRNSWAEYSRKIIYHSRALMFNSVRVTRLTTNLYTRHVHLVCCIDMSYSRYHSSYCFHNITTIREKVLKISLHFFMKTYFWSKKHQLTNKKKNEKMHMIHFLEISSSKKSALKFSCFPLSLYFHWYNNFNTWTKINVKLKTRQK